MTADDIRAAVELARQHDAGHDADMSEADCARCHQRMDTGYEPAAFCTGCIYAVSDDLATALLHLAAENKRMRAVVEWASRWRDETCERLAGCDPSDGAHDAACEVDRNIRDGMAIIDAYRAQVKP